MLREAISKSISFVRRQLTNPSFTQIQIHTTSTWNSGQSCHNVCIHSAKVPLKCFLLNREIFWVQWQRIKYELHVFDWLSGCCYDTGQHTRPSHWLPKCSQVLYFAHKMCSRGICHRASCKAGGVEECQRIAGWVIWRREPEGSQPSLWFIGHRCSVSAPVDASSSKHHFSSTSALTPSIANILIQTPFLLFLVVKPILNISNHKQTNPPIYYVSSHLF